MSRKYSQLAATQLARPASFEQLIKLEQLHQQIQRAASTVHFPLINALTMASHLPFVIRRGLMSDWLPIQKSYVFLTMLIANLFPAYFEYKVMWQLEQTQPFACDWLAAANIPLAATHHATTVPSIELPHWLTNLADFTEKHKQHLIDLCQSLWLVSDSLQKSNKTDTSLNQCISNYKVPNNFTLTNNFSYCLYTIRLFLENKQQIFSTGLIYANIIMMTAMHLLVVGLCIRVQQRTLYPWLHQHLPLSIFNPRAKLKDLHTLNHNDAETEISFLTQQLARLQCINLLIRWSSRLILLSLTPFYFMQATLLTLTFMLTPFGFTTSFLAVNGLYGDLKIFFEKFQRWRHYENQLTMINHLFAGFASSIEPLPADSLDDTYVLVSLNLKELQKNFNCIGRSEFREIMIGFLLEQKVHLINKGKTGLAISANFPKFDTQKLNQKIFEHITTLNQERQRESASASLAQQQPGVVHRDDIRKVIRDDTRLFAENDRPSTSVERKPKRRHTSEPTTNFPMLVEGAAHDCVIRWPGGFVYDSHSTDATKPSVVSLRGNYLKEGRVFAVFTAPRTQFDTAVEYEHFKRIVKDGRIVSPKGATGIVQTDGHIKTKDGWKLAKFKAKDPTRNRRTYGFFSKSIEVDGIAYMLYEFSIHQTKHR